MGGDLHCHTKLSDGSLGIEDLITLAKKREVGTIAITDHDCLAGTVRGKIIGDRFGVQVIPGVELSATDTETGKMCICFATCRSFPTVWRGFATAIRWCAKKPRTI